jgi:hypothetical protein
LGARTQPRLAEQREQNSATRADGIGSYASRDHKQIGYH